MRSYRMCGLTLCIGDQTCCPYQAENCTAVIRYLVETSIQTTLLHRTNGSRHPRSGEEDARCQVRQDHRWKHLPGESDRARIQVCYTERDASNRLLEDRSLNEITPFCRELHIMRLPALLVQRNRIATMKDPPAQESQVGDRLGHRKQTKPEMPTCGLFRRPHRLAPTSRPCNGMVLEGLSFPWRVRRLRSDVARREWGRRRLPYQRCQARNRSRKRSARCDHLSSERCCRRQSLP
jgi:hypothetical protein